MNSIETMAQLIEEETKPATPVGAVPDEQPEALTEERTAEMIETAVKNSTGETARQIAGLAESMAAMQRQIEQLLKPKGENEDNA